MDEIQVMPLAELQRRCRGVELERFIRYLTEERGAQFVCKLNNARVRWTYLGASTRAGYRVLDDGGPDDGGQAFTGLVAVSGSNATDALRYGSVRVSSVEEAWPTSQDGPAVDDVRPIPPADPGRRMKMIAEWATPAVVVDDTADGGRQPTAAVQGLANPTADAVEWTLTAETIFVDRAMATSAVRELCRVDTVELADWAADAADAALLRALRDPAHLQHAGALAIAVDAWLKMIRGNTDAAGLSKVDLEKVLKQKHGDRAIGARLPDGWATYVAYVIKTQGMRARGPRDDEERNRALQFIR